jgi:CDGSH-type Zn-finger protein
MAGTKITVRDNGPVLVEGDLQMLDMAGRAYGLAGRGTVALCRCGHSQKKPFCDGAHKTQGFQSTCEAHELPPPVPKP